MKLDFIEEGQGSAVLLIHSTVAGNKQWRKLIEYLSPHYRILAPNLFGYGSTIKWNKKRAQTLSDQVDLFRSFFEQNRKYIDSRTFIRRKRGHDGCEKIS